MGPVWVLEQGPVSVQEQGPALDWAAARVGPTGRGYKECALPSPE